MRPASHEITIEPFDKLPLNGSFPYLDWTPPPETQRNFESTGIIHPGPDGNFNFNTTEVRRQLIRKFDTSYGCASDPIVAAARGKRPGKIEWRLDSTPIPDNPEPEGPPRIALLFLVVGNVELPKLWSYWFNEARKWSKNEYLARRGAYANTSLSLSEGEIPLFSVYAHVSGNSSTPLLEELQNGLVPLVDSRWGSLMWVQHQLLHSAMKDKRNTAFMFISDSTVPVKPFHFIYEEFNRNPRSRFFFPNVNLPIIRKHDQWVVLNRPHALILLKHPERWTCSDWLIQPYSTMSSSCWAAPDEYLLFHTLSEIVGLTTVQTQINNGFIYPFPIQDFTSDTRLYSGDRFRHTWVCWINENEDCTTLGDLNFRTASPVQYFKINADKFERSVISNRGSWFARKFLRDSRVDVGAWEKPGKMIASKRFLEADVFANSNLPLFEDWLIAKLSLWNETRVV